MKVRMVQFSPLLGNLKKNIEYHLKTVEQAIKDGIELVVFPELSLSGYQLKDIVYDSIIKNGDKIIRDFEEISKKINIVIGTPYEENPGIIYNSAIVFSSGKMHHIHRKVQLPNFGMFEEAMIFKAGDKFMPFKIGDFNAGILICREILFPVNAYLYYMQNVDFIIAISNSPHRGMGKDGFTSHKLWERLGEVYSINFHQNYIFVNRTGFEDGIGFGGGSFFSSAGKGITRMGKYYEDEIIDVDISADAVRRARISANYLRDEKPEIILKEFNRIINGKD
ncbi:MAG: nitrilase-related carbon-nitrogen hydrolase [Acidobacteriota bacterium]